ncbi:TetR/AcrR family transcriptional regulator [Streptomyces sp. NBC_00243]|uniref:TetR/AcrR family transcriptional regulator n=1 Tax=Streptomyces sp. NBC_00243 TaxID=2975688 RepID=UPI002DDAB2E4|nr:TetR/AcrR family transcriptional regulator [Streptomyces sp. NBC_00243]WRZ18585.1 TetR/AcrR family transcriptional regulator [Streptomyces sp. NBC_00243]
MTAPTGAVSRPGKPTRRDQLGAIAAGLFARDGYHNVSVQDIAAAAGLSGPALYRHFRGKQAVLAHVLRAGLDEAEVTLDRCTGSEVGPEPAEVYAQLAALVVAWPEFGILWRRERRHLAPEDAVDVRKHAARISTPLIRALRNQRPELGPSEASLLTWGALSVLGSISEHRVRLPRAAFEKVLTAIVLNVLATDLTAASAPQHSTASPPALLDARREQLLAVSARLFWERGFHAVAMEDIGAAAGIAGPSIYTHFAGKIDLLQTAASRIRERLRQNVTAAQTAGLPASDTLDLLVISYVDTVLDYRDFVAAYFTEGHNLPERDRTELRRFQRAFAVYWAETTSAAASIREPKEARVRVHAAFAVVNDLAQTRQFFSRPALAAELRALMHTILAGG